MLILLLAFFLVLLDQATKELVRSTLSVGAQIPVLAGVFNISDVRNTGAAWGMLSGLSPWLIVVSAVILATIVFFRHSLASDDLRDKIALGCLSAGIVGNLIDRVRLGYVVDFLDFHWAGHHFPSFNVADSSICIGVGLYLLSQWVKDREARRRRRALSAEDA